MSRYLLVGAAVLAVLAVGFFIFGSGTGNVVANTGQFLDESDLIKIPLNEVSRTAAFYDYDGIKFFVVKAKDGSVKTAFDACDVCHGSKKGYRQEGDDMICNKCGNYYPISGLGTRNLRGGGCWPGYLLMKVERDYIVIQKVALESGRYRFA
ncbi:hypothetical protein CMI37_21205 [Candidatus Pacearchaeota archaeon]|nr:hypothetical protein [Candidatus Pacearchaeota archaeon]|tara:strand:- start:2623 stop:3078 length:456 start_codon:yes stop_codon:yes gene_type:complete